MTTKSASTNRQAKSSNHHEQGHWVDWELYKVLGNVFLKWWGSLIAKRLNSDQESVVKNDSTQMAHWVVNGPALLPSPVSSAYTGSSQLWRLLSAESIRTARPGWTLRIGSRTRPLVELLLALNYTEGNECDVFPLSHITHQQSTAVIPLAR